MDIGKDINEREFKGIRDVVRKMYASDGVYGFYRGYFISVLGIGIY